MIPKDAQGKFFVAATVATMLGLGLWRYFTAPPTVPDGSFQLKATAQPNFVDAASRTCDKVNNVLRSPGTGADGSVASQLQAERNAAVESIGGRPICGYVVRFQYDGTWYEFPEPFDLVTGTTADTVIVRLDEQGHVFAKLPGQAMDMAVRKATPR